MRISDWSSDVCSSDLYLKRRARGAEHKSMRIRDGGGGTPGGLIRRLIDVTAAAREHLPGDCLWAYHNVGGLRAGVIDLKYQLPVWADRKSTRLNSSH